MARRANGDGTVFKRADGRWSATLDCGYRNGKRWRRSIYAETQREALQKLRELREATERAQNLGSQRQTVEQFLRRWLMDVVAQTTKPKTEESCRREVEKHLLPSRGRYRLTKLRAQHVQRFLSEQAASGLSPRTVRYHHAILRAALEKAVRWGEIPTNVAKLVSPPRAEKFEIEPLDVAEAQRLLAAVQGHRWEAIYTVGLGMGLRQGEILGLKWEDIDFTAGTLAVRRTLQVITGKRVFETPKTKRSHRTLALPSVARAALLAHRDRQQLEKAAAGLKWQENGVVFTSTIGTPLFARNVLRHFHETLALIGVDRRRFHDLRHTAATLLLAQGVSLRVVMEILGHDQIATTADIYGHVLDSMKSDAADRMDALLNPVAVKLAVNQGSERVQ